MEARNVPDVELCWNAADALFRPISNPIAQDPVGDQVEPQPRDVRLTILEEPGEICGRVLIGRQMVIVSSKRLVDKGYSLEKVAFAVVCVTVAGCCSPSIRL